MSLRDDSPSATPPALPLDDELDEYLLHLKVERGLAANTLSAYARDLADFARFVSHRGRNQAADIESSDVADWSQGLARGGRRASTQARMLVSVRGFFRWLEREGLLDALPTAHVDVPKTVRPLPRIVDSDETRRLLTACGDDLRDRALVALLYGAGLRVSEVVGLELGGLHLEAGVVQVMGKGSKERLVPMADIVAESCRRYVESARPQHPEAVRSERLFPGRARGGGLSRQTVFIRLRRLALAAGFDRPISPHKLRHGFATDLVRGGADLRSVQAMLGHADLRTTEIYTQVDDEHLRRAYDSAHPRR